MLIAGCFAFLLLPSIPLRAATGSAAELQIFGESAAGEVREVPLENLAMESLASAGFVVLEVRGGQEAAPVPPAELARLELAGGDRIQGRIAGGEGEVLRLQLLGGVILPVDIAAFRGLVFPARIPDDLSATVAAPEELDRLYRRVGGSLDPIDGTVEGFTADGVMFESRHIGRRNVPWKEVAALFVEVLGEEAKQPAAKGEPVLVELADESRLRGRMQRLSAAGLAVTVGSGADVLIPLDALAEIARDDGSIAFLSDLPAASEEGRGNPFDAGDAVFGMSWPYRPDRAASGGRLRAGGRIWRRGLGAHAPSRIRWQLSGGWRELRGAVAIDDSVLLEPAEGSVIFRIHLDGKLVWESPTMTEGDPPAAFPPIALSGENDLVLEADMATDLNQGDRADWLRMMLVK